MGMGLPIALMALAAGASARVGDAYELTRIVDRSTVRTDGGSGSSHDTDAIVARVVATRADGVEIEYDLPASTPEDARDASWQFPLRVFRPTTGPARLVDPAGVEARVTAWLAAAKLPRSACGRPFFTWNAFRVECDPQTVLRAVAAFELDRPGETYRDEDARAPVPLVRTADGGSLTAALDLDPERVRRAEAEADVGVGEILHKPVTLEAALAAHAKEAITGTITVTFDISADGAPWRRTRVMGTRRVDADGKVETSTATEVLTRQRLPRD